MAARLDIKVMQRSNRVAGEETERFAARDLNAANADKAAIKQAPPESPGIVNAVLIGCLRRQDGEGAKAEIVSERRHHFVQRIGLQQEQVVAGRGR